MSNRPPRSIAESNAHGLFVAAIKSNILQVSDFLNPSTLVKKVATKRAIVKLDAKKEASKIKRWQAIAEGAAKQSGRMLVPQISEVKTYGEALQMAQKLDINVIPYECARGMEGTREIFGSIKPGMSVGIFIGPEGGFEESEVEDAKALGVHPVTLGKRILRTETAGLTTLSILMYLLEES